MTPWSPGSKTIATVVGGLALIGALALTIRTPPQPKNRSIKAVALSSSGQWIAAGSPDGLIRVWDRVNAAQAKSFELAGTLNDLRFSHSDEHLAIANRDINLVDWRNAIRLRAIRVDKANYGVVRYDSAGRRLLTINGKGEILSVDVATGEARQIHCCSSIWGEVEFTPDNSKVVWGGHWPAIWNLHRNEMQGRLTASRQFMAFGPVVVDKNGRKVFMGSQDGRVYVWDLETRLLLQKSSAQTGYVHTIVLLGNGEWIAYSAQGGPVHLWRPETGEHRILPQAKPASNLVFDGVRNETVFGTASGAVEFWDLLEARRRFILD